MLVRPGTPTSSTCRGASRSTEWQSERLVEVDARHPPPRRALRQLRRAPLRAQGAAAAARAARVPAAARARRRGRAGGRRRRRRHASAGADGHEPEPALITRHLDFSLPYRSLFSGPRRAATCATACWTRSRSCSCGIHLGGFFWGDCSLSNTLFRRDAGTLSAYLVDAETGELHPSAERRAAGARPADRRGERGRRAARPRGRRGRPALGARPDRDRRRGAAPLRGAVVGADARGRLRARRDATASTTACAASTSSASTSRRCSSWARPAASSLRLNPQVVEPGHHRRRLHTLTGLYVQENQARRLLNDLATFRATGGRAGTPESVGRLPLADGVLRAVDRRRSRAELRGKREAAELFHEILEHRWFLSEAARRDVGMPAAVASYVETVLRHRPDEKGRCWSPSDEDERPRTGSDPNGGQAPLRRLRAGAGCRRPGRAPSRGGCRARSAARRAPSRARRPPAARSRLAAARRAGATGRSPAS